MIPKHTMKHALRTAALAVAFSGIAQASVVATWSLEKRMTSANGNVVIGEFTNNSNPNDVGYEVDLSSSTQIHLFAVSHGESDPGLVSKPSGWTFANVAKADWADQEFGRIQGASLGSFESLFGTADTHVIVFTAPDRMLDGKNSPGIMSDSGGGKISNITDVNEANWCDPAFLPRFARGGLFDSEFIAVSTAGTIIAQSIPEPSCALLGSLAAIALLRRRR
jgi:hypothetical protein